MFLIIQREEFLSTNLTFNDSCAGSIFFMLTGFHCVHVVVGMIFISFLYLRLIFSYHIPVREKAILFDITI